MTQIKRYLVIKEDDLGLLVARTTELLSAGWMVLGGIAVGSEMHTDAALPPMDRPFYCQAMVQPRTELDSRKEVKV